MIIASNAKWIETAGKRARATQPWLPVLCMGCKAPELRYVTFPAKSGGYGARTSNGTWKYVPNRPEQAGNVVLISVGWLLVTFPKVYPRIARGILMGDFTVMDASGIVTGQAVVDASLVGDVPLAPRYKTPKLTRAERLAKKLFGRPYMAPKTEDQDA